MKKKNTRPKNANKNPLPEVTIFHRQRSTRYAADRLERIVRAALPHCLMVSHRLGGPLHRLRGIEVSLLGTRRMASIHREFLGIFGATDVITFPYGEIAVCAPVAAARAREFRNSTTTELATYIIHGLLHLAGQDDITPPEAAQMARLQQNIITRACARPLNRDSKSARD